MNALITILDGITETSMPFNEFVLYRARHYPNEKQILIVCGERRDPPKVAIPNNLEIHFAGRRLSSIRKTIKSVLVACKAEKLSYAIHLHQVQSGFLSLVAMIGTGFRKKTLFTVHSTFSGYAFHNKALSFFNAWFARCITCVSNTSYHKYPKLIKKIKKDRIRAVQNGVDTERIDAVIDNESRRKGSGANFIYVARIIPLKNHAFLVRVLQKCDPKVHFIFVGAEDPDGAIRKQAQEAGVIDRITFTGLIPRNSVFAELQAADYYVSSSTLEGLPVSVLEAMYCELPCVLSDIPQHKEAADGIASILPFDEDLWVKELNRLADMPCEERNALGLRSRSYVTEHFSLAHMHKLYDTVYDSLR